MKTGGSSPGAITGLYWTLGRDETVIVTQKVDDEERKHLLQEKLQYPSKSIQAESSEPDNEQQQVRSTSEETSLDHIYR